MNTRTITLAIVFTVLTLLMYSVARKQPANLEYDIEADASQFVMEK